MNCRNYKRLSIVICLCLMLGFMLGMGHCYAESTVKVGLFITNKNVNKKTYSLTNTKHRQLKVKITNASGKVKTKYSSDNPKIASVTKKGYITANSVGTTKIRVKVICKSGKKKVTKKTWVRMRIKPAKDTPESPAYTGEVYNVIVEGFSVPFIVEKSSSAAREFYNDLGSGTQTYEMIQHKAENRYYTALPKNYIERNIVSPPSQYEVGSLVLMGSNEISVITGTMSNHENRASTVIGRLDKSVLPDDTPIYQFMRTYFYGDRITVQICRD